MRALRALVAVAALSLAACESPIATPPGDPTGDWVTDPMIHPPRGSFTHRLSLDADGRFVAETRLYGIYDGQPLGELSARQRTVGTWSMQGNRLIFEEESLTTWDRFYGDDSPETVQSPYPYDPGIYPEARFRAGGTVLKLDFLTFPADAPLATSLTFRRIG